MTTKRKPPSRSAPVTAQQVRAALERQSVGMRAESFAYLRAGGKVQPFDRVRLEQWPDAELAIGNGRHRIALALERGDDHIIGDFVQYGPRGGVRREMHHVRIPLEVKR